MSLRGKWIKLFLVALALSVVELNAKSVKGTRDDSRLAREWLAENEGGDLGEPMEEYVSLLPLKFVRRSALDSDIFANGLRWRKKRLHYQI
nr:hypothetical protein HmN_000189400 [Hymenolepis microstoma]